MRSFYLSLVLAVAFVQSTMKAGHQTVSGIATAEKLEL
jgi:hypothetical protein